jgi:hypothetical protein
MIMIMLIIICCNCYYCITFLLFLFLFFFYFICCCLGCIYENGVCYKNSSLCGDYDFEEDACNSVKHQIPGGIFYFTLFYFIS